MKIIVDIDDTIIDLTTPWIKFLNQKYNLSVKESDITDWNMRLAFPTLTDKQIYTPINRKNFWVDVKPLLGADFYLKKLQDEGNDIYLCTSTHFQNVRYKYEQVIKKYFPYISWNNMIITGDKSIIAGDIMIDDNFENIQSSICKYKYLKTATHNKKFTYDNRVDDWEHIYKTISSIH